MRVAMGVGMAREETLGILGRGHLDLEMVKVLFVGGIASGNTLGFDPRLDRLLNEAEVVISGDGNSDGVISSEVTATDLNNTAGCISRLRALADLLQKGRHGVGLVDQATKVEADNSALEAFKQVSVEISQVRRVRLTS